MSFLLLITLVPAQASDAPLVPRAPLPAEPLYAYEGADSLAVKWRDAHRARVDAAGGLRFADELAPQDQAAIDRILAGATLASWTGVSEPRLRSLEVRAERRSGRAQPDLAGIHRVTVADPTPERLLEVGRALQGLDLVEFVVVEHPLVPPPGDIAPPTPDHESEQGYLDSDPGFDVRYAWSEGFTGAGVTVRDCEYGWDPEHEDLVDAVLFAEAGQTQDPSVVDNGWHHHGTAVAGIVIGQDNGYGMTGMAPAAAFGLYPERSIEEGSRRSVAVANAVADSVPGDIVLLEMQTVGPDGRFAPAELNSAVWLTVRTGVDAGITVIGAAGNGAADLDSEPYLDYRSRGDSGAILVGAGTPDVQHARFDFSTYGARVDVQGWGREVFTTGGGSFVVYGGDVRQAYTDVFSGTSSASALITGASALLMEASFRYRPDGIAPGDLRDLLVDTGIPFDEGIGPFPDLRAALDGMNAVLDITPTILPTAPPGNPPGKVREGEAVAVTAEVRILPTHEPRFVWTLPDATEVEGAVLEFVGEDDGPVEIGVQVFDEWDRSASGTIGFDVVNVPPTLPGPPDVVGVLREGEPLTVSVGEATDPGDDTVTYQWTVDGETLPIDGPSLEVALVEGTHSVEVVAIDDDGGVSDPERASLVVEDVPATLTLSAPSDVEPRQEAVLSVAIEDPGIDDVHTVRWVFGDEETGEGAEVTHAWRSTGVYDVVVTVVDDKGVEVTGTTRVTVERASLLGCATPVGAPWMLGGVVAGLLLRRRQGRS